MDWTEDVPAPRSGRIPEGAGLLPSSCLLLVVAGSSLVYAWRVLTAGGVGANIGGGLAEIFEPFLLAILMSAVILFETAEADIGFVRITVLVVGVWGIALLLAVVLFFNLG